MFHIVANFSNTLSEIGIDRATPMPETP